MINQYVYEITFLEDAFLSECPKYLIIKYFFHAFKKITCLNSEKKCDGCLFQNQCIYYFYSGEHFLRYPAVLIQRNLIEKQNYRAGDVLSILLYSMLPQTQIGYIDAFFNELQTIERYQVRPNKIAVNQVKEHIMFNQTFDIISPVNIEYLREQRDYYASRYHCLLDMSLSSVIMQRKTWNDRRCYRINGQSLKLEGSLGQITFSSLDHRWMMIGIGHLNFIGGGVLHAHKD